MANDAAASAGDAATRLGRAAAGRLDPRRGRALHNHRGIGRLAGTAAGFGMRVGRPLSVRRALDAGESAAPRSTSSLPVGLPVPAHLAAWWRATMTPIAEPAQSAATRTAVRRTPALPPRGLPRVVSAGARSRMGLGTGPAGAPARLQAETITPRREPAVSAVGTVVGSGEHQFRAPAPGTPPVRPVSPGPRPRPERQSPPAVDREPGPQARARAFGPGPAPVTAARVARAVQPAPPATVRRSASPRPTPSPATPQRRTTGPSGPVAPAASAVRDIARTPSPARGASARAAGEVARGDVARGADFGAGRVASALAPAEPGASLGPARSLGHRIGARNGAPRHPAVSPRGVVGRAHTLTSRAEALVARRWAATSPLPVAAAPMARGDGAGAGAVARLGEGLGVPDRFGVAPDSRLGGLATALSRQALPSPPRGWSPSRDATPSSPTVQRRSAPEPRASAPPAGTRRAATPVADVGVTPRTTTPARAAAALHEGAAGARGSVAPGSPASLSPPATATSTPATSTPAAFAPLQRTLSSPASEWRVLGSELGGFGRAIGSGSVLERARPAHAPVASVSRLQRALSSPSFESSVAASSRVTSRAGALRPPSSLAPQSVAGSSVVSGGTLPAAPGSSAASTGVPTPISEGPAARRGPGAARARRFAAALGARRSDPPRLLPAPLRRLARAIAGPEPVEVRTGPATRAALRVVGRRGATVGRRIHLAAEPDASPAGAEVFAHELVHAAHRPAAPAFFDDHPSPEEHLAHRVGTLARLLATRDTAAPTRDRRGMPVGTAGLQVAGTFSAAAGASPIRRSAEVSPAPRGVAPDLLRRFTAAHRASGASLPASSATSSGAGTTIQRQATIQRQHTQALAPPSGLTNLLSGMADEPPTPHDVHEDAGAGLSADDSALASAARFDHDTPSPVPSPPLIQPPGDPLPAETLEWIIERIERRVVEELERRGQRFYPGVF